MDHCRVWESHADSDNRRGSRPGPKRALPIYMVDDAGGGRDDRTVAAVTTSPTVPEQLEPLLRRLLPTPVVPPPPPPPTRFGAIVSTATGWGPDTAACPTSEDWNHCDRNFAAKFASRESVPGFSDTAGPQTSGLGYGAGFLVWQNRSWGDPMSCAGCVISFLAAGMEGGEGGERIRYDLSLSPCGSGALLGRKRRLIRGGGSAAWISNGTRPQDPGGGEARRGSLLPGTWPCLNLHPPIGSRTFG